MNSQHFFTDEKNAQIVIALLKAHGIRKIIASPGTTNIAIVGSVQNDPWFQVYSGVDERHSAYMAVGMAAESGEPVVLSCTGATASRNYLPALTEAFYRKLPILAVTSMHDLDTVGQLAPQTLDRSVTQTDVVCKSVVLRTVRSKKDATVCARKVNEAILALTRHGGGPAHINLEMGGCMTFNTKELPHYDKIERIEVKSLGMAPELPQNAKIALFLGSGICSEAWSVFAKHHNVAVFRDVGVNYHGDKTIRASLVCSQNGAKGNPDFSHLNPDLIIDAGEVSGDYPSVAFLSGKAPVWRVSEDGEIRSRFGRLSYVFEMSPELFVNKYFDIATVNNASYADDWRSSDAAIRSSIGDLPFSNVWIAKELSGKIPCDWTLHTGILNSLRSWNLFPPREAVNTFSNVGGFGIDGGLSTAIGSSLANPDKMFLCVLGDLSFFYDLNALGNRAIGKNLRVLLVNNGCGTEFNMYWHPGSQFGSQTNDFIAAGGHFSNKSKDIVRHYSQDLGFTYLSACNKEDFQHAMELLLQENVDAPLLLECFTSPQLESEAHKLLRNLKPYMPAHHRTVKDMIPKRLKNVVKAVIGG